MTTGAIPDEITRNLQEQLLLQDAKAGNCRPIQVGVDKLTDQKEEEVLIFDKVKELMDAEALSPEPMLTALDKSLEMAKFSG